MRILIVPSLSGKPWNGATVYSEPLGGSESAVVYIARGLALAGATVSVVCHGTPGVFDGVEYFNVQSIGFLMGQEWDVLVVSRWTEMLSQPWNARFSVLWIHDLPQASVGVKCHAVFTISDFQAAAWGISSGARYATRNGFDPRTAYLDPFAMRDNNKLIWASNPDRGLPVAAKIFQELRQRWPDLELHVYGRSSIYGWSEDVEMPYLPRREHMQNVFMHQAEPRARLHAEFRTAFALFYPTYWPETSCMTAIEAQACGLPVLTSPVGALPETVQGGVLTNDFLNAVSQLKNYNRWRKLSEAGLEHVRGRCEWNTIAQEWVKYLDFRLARTDVPAPGDDDGDQSIRAENLLPTLAAEQV